MNKQNRKNATEDLTNRQFSSWKVIERDISKKEPSWKCQCVCGRIRILKSRTLKDKKSEGCLECYLNRIREGCGGITGKYWSQTRSGAKLRNLPFEITISYAWGLFLIQNGKCALTNVEIVCGENASLDRIDSNKGYVVGNVQWVDKVINKIKNNLPEKELLNQCEKIVSYDEEKRKKAVKAEQIIKKHTIGDGSHIIIDLKKSFGSWLVDQKTGNRYLDCVSQYASQPIGWNHPKFIEKICRLQDGLNYNLVNSDFYSEPYAQFVETFAKACPDFKYHFFISGGTLGVENALKVAFDWKSKKLDLNDEESNGLDVIHLKDAFHGRSGYTLSLTNTHRNKTEFFPKFNWTRITNPKLCSEWPVNQILALEETEKAMQKNNVAAFIMETIQGEGGDGHFNKSFFAEVRKLCDKYEVMFILDEVQCGVGLTGKMWAYEHFDVIPDLIAFGKKSQVCGCSSTGRVDEIPDNVFHVPSRINSTWGGNIVDMVRSTIYLEIMKEDNLISNAKIVGDYFKIKLEKLGLLNLRGRGLMIAFDFDTTKSRDDFLNRLNPKMIAMPCGNNSVRLRPHLTFGQAEADCAVDFIKEVL